MSNLIRLQSKAPTRIDLAGGTVDIWPIFLMVEKATTINLGINLFAEATLEHDLNGKDGIQLCAVDQGAELHLSWDDLEQAEFPPSVALHGKLLRHFVSRELPRDLVKDKKRGSFRLATQAKSPSGAGLGGSSTLSVAMIGALAHWAKGGLNVAQEGEKYVEITRDVETTVIKVPAGIQDYYGAMFGNLQAWHWRAGKHHRETFGNDALKEVEARTTLFYSGQSRNSGINNWALFKAFIDGDKDVHSKFADIMAATHQLGESLKEKDWKGAAKAIRYEWSARRSLAPGITTPAIDKALQTAEREFSGVGKICGAGGGGCFFVYLPDSDPGRRKKMIERVLSETGSEVRALDFKAVPHGVEVNRL